MSKVNKNPSQYIVPKSNISTKWDNKELGKGVDVSDDGMTVTHRDFGYSKSGTSVDLEYELDAKQNKTVIVEFKINKCHEIAIGITEKVAIGWSTDIWSLKWSTFSYCSNGRKFSDEEGDSCGMAMQSNDDYYVPFDEGDTVSMKIEFLPNNSSGSLYFYKGVSSQKNWINTQFEIPRVTYKIQAKLYREYNQSSLTLKSIHEFENK